jgi:thioredoxin-like negative regulator of GroEL
MENQNSEKDRLVFLDQFNTLCQKNMFPDALVLAQERLKVLPTDADAYVAVGEAQIAMAHLEEARRMLCDLENTVSALTGVFSRMGELYAK